MEKKWHQQPYVWFLISIPATSVILSLSLVFIAINGRDPMVVDDYYRKGKAMNEVLERDRQAAAMGLFAEARIDDKNNIVNLEIKSNNNFLLPEILELKITHATRGELDKLVRLYQAKPGFYSGQFSKPGLLAGKWYLELGTKKWRVTAQAILPDSQTITLKSGS